MEFDVYQNRLRAELPVVVQKSLHCKTDENPFFSAIHEPCRLHYKEWGFRDSGSAWEAAVSRSSFLSIYAWSKSNIVVGNHCYHVASQPFFLERNDLHLYVRKLKREPLASFTPQNRMFHVPFPEFANGMTVQEFVRTHMLETTQTLSLSR